MIPIIRTLSTEKQSLLGDLVDRLSRVPGMTAVVLGGSYATGSAHAGSDMDVGLYYDDSVPFSIDEIRGIAESVAVQTPVTVTELYGWGPWVNGGAWIHTTHGKVDFIYRSLNQVERVISDTEAGLWQHDFEQQPTHGFFSVIYLAETKACIPLFDPQGQIAALKHRVETYPPKLKTKIVADSLWLAEFTLMHAHNFAAQGDVYNTAGCLHRTASYLTQALFALNETYFMRDKKVLEIISRFALLPTDYNAQLQVLLAHPGSTAAELQKSVAALEELWCSVTALPGANYTPKFTM